MNYLELVRTTWRECGLSGDGPAGVVNQTDMAGRIVQYVGDAYAYVQQQHEDWNFHWRHKAANLVVDQSNYAFGDFGIQDFRALSRVLLMNPNGSWRLLERNRKPTEHEMVRFDNPQPGTPDQFYLMPNKTLQLNAVPQDTTPIRFEYFRTAHVLEQSGDVPLIPEEFHLVIVFKAQEYYAYFDEDAAMAMAAGKSYTSALHRLQRSQLPELTFAADSGFF